MPFINPSIQVTKIIGETILIKNAYDMKNDDREIENDTRTNEIMHLSRNSEYLLTLKKCLVNNEPDIHISEITTIFTWSFNIGVFGQKY